MTMVEVFVAAAGYNFTITKVLIAYLHDSSNLRWLCGWESSQRDGASDGRTDRDNGAAALPVPGIKERFMI